MDLNIDEQIIKEERSMYLKGIQGTLGILCLTNQRLFFKKDSAFMIAMFGLLGWFLSKRKKLLFSIPLNEISEYSRSKFGRNNNVLLIRTKDGIEAKFNLNSKYEEWEDTFKNLI